MDQRPVIVGTARGIYNDRAIVRCHDGRSLTFRIEGGKPSLGEDIVGRVGKDAEGNRVLDISPQTRKSLSEDATISLFGDPELASRLLLRLSKGTAAIGPGRGSTITRSRKTGDADLDWAMEALRNESLARGISLNVLDVRALAASPWATERLAEMLPSDVCDDPHSTSALLDCLRSGFAPTTRLILEPTTDQQSVEFIIPYNPCAGGWNFLQREAGAARREWPTRTIAASDARKLSALRQMALAFAPSILPRSVVREDDDVGRACIRRRLAHAFADAAAALAWRRAGGDTAVLEIWADAKEASAAGLAEMTHVDERADVVSRLTAGAIRSAARNQDAGRGLLDEAAKIAVRISGAGDLPDNRLRMIELAQGGHAARERLFVDCDSIHANDREALKRSWLQDLADCMAHLGDDSVALSRMATVGRTSVPLGMQDIFDMEMEAVGVLADVPMFPEDGLLVDDFAPTPL